MGSRSRFWVGVSVGGIPGLGGTPLVCGLFLVLAGRCGKRYNGVMNTSDLITIDPEILGGSPVFKGTRVPVKSLFDYLEDNYTLEEFLECFPTVTRRWLAGCWSGLSRRCWRCIISR